MKRSNTVWRLIAKSLGEKSGKNNEEADKIALIRLLMFLSILITNSFIVANALRHWNDKTVIEVYVDQAYVPSPLSSEEKQRILSAKSGRFPYD